MNTLASSGGTLQTVRPSMPIRRIIGAYFNEAKFEFFGALRTLAFAVPFLLLPVMIYLLFGVAMSGDAIAKNPKLANFLFCSFSVFAISGPAIFGIGVGVAMERDAGLLKLKRALPLPPGSYVLAKMLMAMLFAVLTFTSLLITALIVGQLTLSVWQLASIAVVMIVGALPFCAIGLFLGVYLSGSAAPAVGNLVYLPSIWLGGLFIPLPKFLQGQAVIWPTFHLNQIATGVADLKEFHVVPTLVSVGVLVGMTVLFGGLAIHRLARKG
jgi:ABC-2 type transport system permease protein